MIDDHGDQWQMGLPLSRTTDEIEERGGSEVRVLLNPTAKLSGEGRGVLVDGVGNSLVPFGVEPTGDVPHPGTSIKPVLNLAFGPSLLGLVVSFGLCLRCVLDRSPQCGVEGVGRTINRSIEQWGQLDSVKMLVVKATETTNQHIEVVGAKSARPHCLRQIGPTDGQATAGRFLSSRTPPHLARPDKDISSGNAEAVGGKGIGSNPGPQQEAVGVGLDLA
jgi:hypothetical protein